MTSERPLLDLLNACADTWAQANMTTLAQLSLRVTGGNNRFFRDLAAGSDPGVGRVERFARFLHDPANWPEGLVPEVACELAHRVGVSGAALSAATGQAVDLSGLARAERAA
ncbi:hypothetical protein [Aurantiacibacter luteus]|uniref:Uncharacterized protein n=1 Tax=Aurantiacibacter luteus TaxID=1581420 RepID=A0A0G9MSY6_9SPHN|nr:hypothetical protein [Aurantiacibacter luteus]KLE32438.1 hypothetical protein AAW00_13475 [Aurantiacibacter luteus]